MEFIADFHIHSKYSRATSKNISPEILDYWAGIKGIKVLGTGDFTHPVWLGELREKLREAEPGFYKIKDEGTRFVLSSEISCIYSKKGKVRKIHIVVLSPSFDDVEKINERLGRIGNLKSDGRPILGLDAKELVKIILETSPRSFIIPAHCLLPDTYIHGNPGIKKIRNISVGDKVFTHEGRLRRVKRIYTRFYNGLIYNIKPYNFGLGLKTTAEHPFFIIKSYKDCKNSPSTICKPNCAYYRKRGCSHPYFVNYRPEWVRAEDIKKGDIIVFSRFNREIKDIGGIKFSDYLSEEKFKTSGGKISCGRGRTDKKLYNRIKIDKNFCRLIGYYLSEGYTDNRDSVSFCFNLNERRYIEDLKLLMHKVFGLYAPRVYKRKNADSIEIIYFSKILAKAFSKLFYNHSTIKRAHTKSLPFWALSLPIEKQVEIFRGWWYGDVGVTSSRELMNQMKIICLRLGIIPSISEQSEKDFNKRAHKYSLEGRIIKARYNSFVFHNLSFFQDIFGLLKTFSFKKFNTKLNRRHGWVDEKNIYIPVRDIKVENYKGKVYNLEIEDDNSYLAEFATVHNCMTPWFSLFGSRSGFDSIEECFGDYSKYIFAVETGLSADCPMLWRMSALDNLSLVSNSDAHSPRKLGREANVFNTELSYTGIIEAIKSKDPKKFLYTIEFFPQEGKYHYDGHRNCGLRVSPEEAERYNNICPRCGKPLTLGVCHRVRELADKEKGTGVIPFKSLIPLEEVIAESLGYSSLGKRVEREYQNLIKKIGSEFDVLLKATQKELRRVTLPEIAQGIVKAREGEVAIEPGYDGVFGKVSIFSGGKRKKEQKQITLFGQ